jgi:nucleoside-diphosphate-sugar epimerase
MKATWADITKAKRLLNWQPEVSPEEGFKRTVEWHIENRNWLKRIKL